MPGCYRHLSTHLPPGFCLVFCHRPQVHTQVSTQQPSHFRSQFSSNGSRLPPLQLTPSPRPTSFSRLSLVTFQAHHLLLWKGPLPPSASAPLACLFRKCSHTSPPQGLWTCCSLCPEPISPGTFMAPFLIFKPLLRGLPSLTPLPRTTAPPLTLFLLFPTCFPPAPPGTHHIFILLAYFCLLKRQR